MSTTGFTVGSGTYGRLNADPFVRWYTFPQSTQISAQIRFGHDDSLKKLRGTVLRGYDLKGVLRNMGNVINPNITITLAPGATDGSHKVVVPLTVGAGRTVDDAWTLSMPVSSVPIGRFYQGANDPNTNQWGGLSLSSVQILEVGPPSDAGVRVNSSTLTTSAPPTWQFIGPSNLTVGQTVGTELRLRVAYGDGEPVVGLAVKFTALNPSLNIQAPDGRWLHEVTTLTDASGNIVLPTQAIKSGGTGVAFACVDSRSNPTYFEPQLSDVWAINSDPAVVGGLNCVVVPPQPAIPRVPASTRNEVVTAWDAGANSIIELDGDVEISVRMLPAVGVVLGLTPDRSEVENFSRLTHGLYFSHNDNGQRLARVMESGKILATAKLGYTDSDVFTLRRVGGNVIYAVNGSVVYRSRTQSSGTVTCGSALYSSGDSI